MAGHAGPLNQLRILRRLQTSGGIPVRRPEDDTKAVSGGQNSRTPGPNWRLQRTHYMAVQVGASDIEVDVRPPGPPGAPPNSPRSVHSDGSSVAPGWRWLPGRSRTFPIV